MKYATGLATAVLCSFFAADPASSSDPDVEAIYQAIAVNVNYAQDWTTRRDHKSLNSSAASLSLLADILQRQSDDPAWQRQVAGLRMLIDQLSAAATKSEFEAAKGALEDIARHNQSWRAPKTWEKQPANKPSANLDQMMFLLDGTYADAKLAASLGEADEAQQHVKVLAELALSLEQYKQSTAWKRYSEGLRDSALKITNGAFEAKQLRAELRRIDQSCRDCHNRQ